MSSTVLNGFIKGDFVYSTTLNPFIFCWRQGLLLIFFIVLIAILQNSYSCTGFVNEWKKKEWYAIKFCFKLGKNATETYGMLQTAFRPSCMNWASVFEWHKRFKEGRESVRVDERCGRSKKVRTTELIGQIKNFMDKDRRVSIETISAQFDVSVGTVHTIICKELKMQKICTRVLREDQKERCWHNSRDIVELINSNLAVLNALVTCDESWIYCYDPETKRQEFPVEAC